MNEGQVIDSFTNPLYPVVVGRLKRACKVSAAGIIPHHYCSRFFCSPQNEVQYIRSGTLQQPCLSNNVYICKFGTLHLCTEKTCALYADAIDHTCPVSGIQYGVTGNSSYDKNDYRTWNGGLSDPHPTVTGKSKRPRAEPTATNVQQHVTDLVELLLYSNKRITCNSIHTNKLKQHAKHATDTYVNEQNRRRQLPFLTDVYRINAQCTSAPLPYAVLVRDPARVAYYTAAVMHIWNLIDVTNRRLSDATEVALGTLYTMRTGIAYDKDQVLPEDVYLNEHLPKFNDLTEFGVDKTNVTCGMTIVRNVIENIVSTTGSHVGAILDASVLPAMDAPNKMIRLSKNGAIDKRKDFV